MPSRMIELLLHFCRIRQTIAYSIQLRVFKRSVLPVKYSCLKRHESEGEGKRDRGPAQDYTSDKIESFDKLYMGKRVVENVDADVISGFYNGSGVVSAGVVNDVQDPIANENFILRAGSKSVLASFKAATNSFVRVEKKTCYGISPRNAEQSFAVNALLDDDIKLVTLAGTAGTGKHCWPWRQPLNAVSNIVRYFWLVLLYLCRIGTWFFAR